MNKCFTLFISFLFFSSRLFAQTPGDTANTPYWIDMMQDFRINYNTTVSAFNKYYENRTIEPHTGYKVFKRWQEYWLTRVDANGNFPANDALWNAYYDYFGTSSSVNNSSIAGNWQPLGPNFVPGNSTGQPNGNGRVNSVAFHPTDTNKFWIGAPQGGLWSTSDGGLTWASNTDNLPTLGVSAILIDPINTNIMYIGSGDRDAGDAPGLGILKSTNGGATWSQINNGLGNFTVGMMEMNKYNSNIIIAATSSGIYKTINAGNTWVKKSSNSNNYKDIKYHPTDTNIVYAVEGVVFYRSTDAGNTFTAINGGTSGLNTTGNRCVIGVSKASPNMVYLVQSNGAYKGTYLSFDKGLTFVSRSTTPNIFDYNADGSGTKTQAWYDMAVAVDTGDIGVIYVGGVNVFKSADSAKTWTCYAHWVGGGFPSIHADQHALAIDPKTNKLYCGNDGGIYSRSKSATAFTNLTSGLNISQIYRIGQSAQTPSIVIAGWQDNGTGFYRNSISGTNKWKTTMGGDGMECIIDPTDSNFMYGALYYGNINRTTTGSTLTSTVSNNGSFGINEDGAWITPYILHEKNPNVMFVGYKNVWRGKNIKTTPTWKQITKNSTSNITFLEHCASDTSRLYYSRSDAKFFRTDSLYLDTPKFRDLTSKTPTPTSTVNWIETHPSKPNTVYIIQNNNIYRSNDTGNTWVNINGTLPGGSRNCLLLDREATDGIYVGTDVGVFYRDSTMTTWVPFKNNMPATSRITELEMFYDYANTTASRISASTYGRGLWQSDVYLTNSAPVTSFIAQDTAVCINGTTTLLDLSSGSPDFWQWTITPSTFTYINGTNANSQNPQVNFNAIGNYTVRLYSRKKGWGYNTLEKSNFVKVYALPVVSVSGNRNICIGDNTLLTGGGGNSYAWYDGSVLISNNASYSANPTSTKTYKLICSSIPGCSDSMNVIVTVNSKPNVTITPNSAKLANGQMVRLTGSGAASYTWAPSSGLSATTGTSVVASPNVTTTYTATGTDANNCTDTQTVTITIASTGIHNLELKSQVLIQPNPAHNEVNITVPWNCSITLYDLTGKIVLTKEISTGKNVLTIDQLPRGVYTAEVAIGDEKLYSKLLLR